MKINQWPAAVPRDDGSWQGQFIVNGETVKRCRHRHRSSETAYDCATKLFTSKATRGKTKSMNTVVKQSAPPPRRPKSRFLAMTGAVFKPLAAGAGC